MRGGVASAAAAKLYGSTADAAERWRRWRQQMRKKSVGATRRMRIPPTTPPAIAAVCEWDEGASAAMAVLEEDEEAIRAVDAAEARSAVLEEPGEDEGPEEKEPEAEAELEEREEAVKPEGPGEVEEAIRAGVVLVLAWAFEDALLDAAPEVVAAAVSSTSVV